MRIELYRDKTAPTEFEQEYLSLRRKEGRVYPDEMVQRLPVVPPNHPLWKEWRIRAFSAEKLAAFLSKKKQFLQILEVGCGNGWLSHRLSGIDNVSVVGMDINLEELQQAKRIFSNRHLSFVYGELGSLPDYQKFDIIVFAASLQYFPSVKEIIDCTLEKMKPGGEIHILDTHFYQDNTQQQATQRSREYFSQLGHPQMERFYFHHSLDDLAAYPFKILFNPHSIKNRILKQSPFCWISIQKC